MRRTLMIATFGLFVWLLAANAFAGQPGLAETTWFGPITIVDSQGNAPYSDNATIKFSSDSGEFIAGEFSRTLSSDVVDFGGLKYGHFVKMTGVGYLMGGEIFKGRWHKKKPPTYTMVIEGSDLADGMMFKGILTLQEPTP